MWWNCQVYHTYKSDKFFILYLFNWDIVGLPNYVVFVVVINAVYSNSYGFQWFLWGQIGWLSFCVHSSFLKLKSFRLAQIWGHNVSLLSNSCNIQKYIFQNQKLLPSPTAMYLNERSTRKIPFAYSRGQ